MTFEIAFTPVYKPSFSLTVSVSGAVLSVNGDAIDLSPLGDGDLLPAEAAQAMHPLLAYAPIERLGNTIHLTLAQPYGYSEPWTGPPVTVVADGPVALPFPSEGEPITGNAEIAVDPGTIIRATTREAEAAAAARKAEFPNLSPDQFWFGLRAAGYEADVRAWVAHLNDPGTEEEPNPDYDPVSWAAASAKLEFASFFERDHPLVEAFRQAVEMPEHELDDLWKYAAFGLEPTAE